MLRRAGYPKRMKQIDSMRLTAQPAALGWRLLALAYDCLPMIPLLMLTSALFLWLNGGQTVERAPWVAALQFIALWTLVAAYFVVSWRRGGQTVGMRPWRLMVARRRGVRCCCATWWRG